MEFVKALFDLIKGLAWPAVILVVAFIFKDDIRSLLPRLRKAGPTGLELDPTEQQQSLANQPIRHSGSIELKALPGLSRTPAIERVELEIHSSLVQIDDDKRVDVLVRYLAESRLSAVFERIYGLIFGSQILVLRRFNGLIQASIKDAHMFFEGVQARHPEVYNDYGFEGWLGFLISQGLIQRTDEALSITDLGRDFLIYIDAARLPENKSF